MTTASRVVVISELSWAFRDHGQGSATVTPRTDLTRYGTSIGVDPFPAYAHDGELIAQTLDQVTAAFPLPEPFAPTIFLLEHEVLSRTNGQAGIEFDYDWEPPADAPKEAEYQRPWRGYIVLSGKRIPPHPAYGRYLVAHEYGHIVEDWLIRQRGERAQSAELLHEYAELRGMPPSTFVTGAGGGTWHKAIQEIFANDFRILRTGLEAEYWPHAGVERPDGIGAITDFWAKAH